MSREDRINLAPIPEEKEIDGSNLPNKHKLKTDGSKINKVKIQAQQKIASLKKAIDNAIKLNDQENLALTLSNLKNEKITPKIISVLFQAFLKAEKLGRVVISQLLKFFLIPHLKTELKKAVANHEQGNFIYYLQILAHFVPTGINSYWEELKKATVSDMQAPASDPDFLLTCLEAWFLQAIQNNNKYHYNYILEIINSYDLTVAPKIITLLARVLKEAVAVNLKLAQILIVYYLNFLSTKLEQAIAQQQEAICLEILRYLWKCEPTPTPELLQILAEKLVKAKEAKLPAVVEELQGFFVVFLKLVLLEAIQQKNKLTCITILSNLFSLKLLTQLQISAILLELFKELEVHQKEAIADELKTFLLELLKEKLLEEIKQKADEKNNFKWIIEILKIYGLSDLKIVKQILADCLKEAIHEKNKLIISLLLVSQLHIAIQQLGHTKKSNDYIKNLGSIFKQLFEQNITISTNDILIIISNLEKIYSKEKKISASLSILFGYCVYFQQQALYQLLWEKFNPYININYRGKDGNTLLMHLVKRGIIPGIRDAMKFGADPFAINNCGKLAKDFIQQGQGPIKWFILTLKQKIKKLLTQIKKGNSLIDIPLFNESVDNIKELINIDLIKTAAKFNNLTAAQTIGKLLAKFPSAEQLEICQQLLMKIKKQIPSIFNLSSARKNKITIYMYVLGQLIQHLSSNLDNNHNKQVILEKIAAIFLLIANNPYLLQYLEPAMFESNQENSFGKIVENLSVADLNAIKQIIKTKIDNSFWEKFQQKLCQLLNLPEPFNPIINFLDNLILTKQNLAAAKLVPRNLQYHQQKNSINLSGDTTLNSNTDDASHNNSQQPQEITRKSTVIAG